MQCEGSDQVHITNAVTMVEINMKERKFVSGREEPLRGSISRKVALNVVVVVLLASMLFVVVAVIPLLLVVVVMLSPLVVVVIPSLFVVVLPSVVVAVIPSLLVVVAVLPSLFVFVVVAPSLLVLRVREVVELLVKPVVVGASLVVAFTVVLASVVAVSKVVVVMVVLVVVVVFVLVVVVGSSHRKVTSSIAMSLSDDGPVRPPNTNLMVFSGTSTTAWCHVLPWLPRLVHTFTFVVELSAPTKISPTGSVPRTSPYM